MDEALRVIDEAEKRGIILRLLGAVAVRYHCPKFGHLYQEMKRVFTDLDFMTYGKFRPGMKKFFVEMGYTPNDRIIAFYGHKRHIYYDNKTNRQADIFFDKLEFCHVVDFNGRLELDKPTITLTDVLLEKMQIVRINEKDIKDTIVMLREHDLGAGEHEMLNLNYVSKILAEDWGFYYTVTTNLKKVQEFLTQYEALSENDRKDVSAKIDNLLQAIENAPKSFKWKMRARVGTSKKWYTEVEEITR